MISSPNLPSGIEIWKDIPGCENIMQASTLGRIRSLDRSMTSKNGKTRPYKGRIIVPVRLNGGYYIVSLPGQKRRLIHRVIATTFIPNSAGKPCVNHKNGDKSNNSIENLEWVTYSENVTHAYRVLGYKPNANQKGRFGALSHSSKKVGQYSLDGGLIKVYDAINDAARALNINQSCISANCRLKTKTCKGYVFKYA